MEPTNTNTNTTESASLRLNNFVINLSRTATQLVINAEQYDTFKRFHLTITPENVKDLTSNIFRDIGTMYAGLLDACDQTVPGVQIILSDDARLHYSKEREASGIKMNDQFTLCLQEEEIDDSKRQARLLDKVLEKLAQQEARIALLEKENSSLKSDADKITLILARLESIEKVMLPEVKETTERVTKRVEESLIQRIERIERELIPEIQKTTEKALSNFEESMKHIDMHLDEKIKPPEPVISQKFEFDPNCTNGSSFSFSNGNKTIMMNSVSRLLRWRACIATAQLIKSHTTKFSIKVDNTSSSYIMVGICPSNIKTESCIYNKQGVYCYSAGSSGFISVNGKCRTLAHSDLAAGSVLTVTVDLSGNIIKYDVDGISVNTTNLNSLLTNSEDYYPFVELYNQNDKVTFI